jgi:16S rRNA (uracil1498-N3)-methyltransferase
MHQRRLFLEFPQSLLASLDSQGGSPLGLQLELPPDQSHYLRDVLRMSPGQELVIVCSQTQCEYHAKVAHIEQLEDRRCVLEIIKPLAQPKATNSIVTSLSFALCKGSKNDEVCEKATELGVQCIILWQAQRSIAKLHSQELEKKRTRWQKICESAACQSGRSQVPLVVLATSLAERANVLAQHSAQQDLFLCCSLAEDAIALRDVPPPSAGVHIIVGPEGDFSPQEEQLLLESGHTFASLGPLRLRSETAAMAALAAAQALWLAPPKLQ